MTNYLRINFKALGTPDPEPAPGSKPRMLYARCEDADPSAPNIPGACDLLCQIIRMAPKDQKAALAALHKLVQVAASGKPITEFYDKKQCHEIHTFHHDGKDRTIWRIWKGDVVRVTFFYGDGQTVLLTHAFAKYEDKLTKAQKKMLEGEVITYLDALKANKLKFFEK